MKLMLTYTQIHEKIMGHLTKNGKKSLAFKIWFKTLLLLKLRYGFSNPMTVVYKAIDNIRPVVTLKRRKIGATTYQIPYLIRNEKIDNSSLIAIRWLMHSVLKKRHERTIEERLAKELMDAFHKEGYSAKLKAELYALAMQNRIYTKYL